MKKLPLTIILNDTIKDLRNGTASDVDALMTDFNFMGSNQEHDAAYNMVSQLVIHSILDTQHSYIKKEFDKSKKGLDLALAGLGIEPSGVAGETTEMYHADGVTFSKKRNKNGTTTLLTDVLNHLARLGVAKDLIDKAVAKAEKPKKGNTYYIIEVDD